MPLTKAKKKEIASSLTEDIKGSESAVFVKFVGLTVSEVTALRSSLRQNKIGYVVTKKTLLKRALDEAKIEGTLPATEGQIALVYGTDAVAPAKAMAEFAAKNKEKFSIVGGVLTGKFLSASEMIALSKIPSREVLLSKLLNVMNAPIQGLAATLAGVSRNFVVVLDQIVKKQTA